MNQASHAFIPQREPGQAANPTPGTAWRAACTYFAAVCLTQTLMGIAYMRIDRGAPDTVATASAGAMAAVYLLALFAWAWTAVLGGHRRAAIAAGIMALGFAISEGYWMRWGFNDDPSGVFLLLTALGLLAAAAIVAGAPQHLPRVGTVTGGLFGLALAMRWLTVTGGFLPVGRSVAAILVGVGIVAISLHGRCRAAVLVAATAFLASAAVGAATTLAAGQMQMGFGLPWMFSIAFFANALDDVVGLVAWTVVLVAAAGRLGQPTPT